MHIVLITSLYSRGWKWSWLEIECRGPRQGGRGWTLPDIKHAKEIRKSGPPPSIWQRPQGRKSQAGVGGKGSLGGESGSRSIYLDAVWGVENLACGE